MLSYNSYAKNSTFPPSGGSGGSGIPVGPLVLRGVSFDAATCPGNPQSTGPTDVAVRDFVVSAPGGALFEYSWNTGANWNTGSTLNFAAPGGPGFVCTGLGTQPLQIRDTTDNVPVDTFIVASDNTGVC
jgi:hypothetical protein